MTFLAIVAVFIIVQFSGALESVQSDAWYRKWSASCRNLSQNEQLQLVLQLVGPLLILWLALSLVAEVSSLLLFILTLPLLLYSLGRGDFSEWVHGYIEAFRRNDNEVAADYAERLGADISEAFDWPPLHRKVLQRAGYRGFERWFSVIFWFVMLGPLGAVFYRLVALASVNSESSVEVRKLAAWLLWVLEWPAVRLLGLTFALTGNFTSCVAHCWNNMWDAERSTEEVLEGFIHGGLNINGSELSIDTVTEQEIEALQPLLSRSLILWISVLAITALI